MRVNLFIQAATSVPGGKDEYHDHIYMFLSLFEKERQQI